MNSARRRSAFPALVVNSLLPLCGYAQQQTLSPDQIRTAVSSIRMQPMLPRLLVRCLWVRRAAAMVATLIAFTACGVPLPSPQTYYRPIKQQDPGYDELQLRKAAVDHLSLADGQKNEAKAQLTTQANLIKSLNAFGGVVSDANVTNQTYSSGYSWTNGVVGGLGAALAAIDKTRNWGPVAGGVGAVWNLLGLTLQKAFVDPKVSAGTNQMKDIEAVSPKYDAAADAWQSLISASAADTPTKYQAWLSAVRAANSQAATVLKVLQQLNL